MQSLVRQLPAPAAGFAVDMGEGVRRSVAHEITGCPSILNIGAAIRAVKTDDFIFGNVVRALNSQLGQSTA
jgi:hypothetical protein